MRRVLLAGGFLLALAAGWRMADACGPDFVRAVFSFARHPDLPRTAYVDGRLGVLQPGFARSYLVIAYRYMNGIGLNEKEREQARDYYKDREGSDWDPTGVDWPARWRAVRAEVTVPPAPRTRLITGGQLSYNPETNSFALNCAEDAFRVAIHTLQERRSRFGETSRAFRTWVTAQDQVFRNCDARAPSIPSERVAADLPPLIRADRAYQVAAAHFYSGDYTGALQRFGRIGRDGASPWRPISRYLVVRTLLRMTEEPQAATAAGARLDTEASAILADPALNAVHGMTWNLVERAGLRKRDQNYFRSLGRLLASRGQDDGLREALWNYTDLYDQMIRGADPNEVYGARQDGPVDRAVFRDPDLTDWIFHFQLRDASAFAHSLRRWRETQSPAWLLAAITHTSAATARSAGLLDAVAAIPEDSPVYLTARFHLFRMMLELGDKAAAREGVDRLLAGPALTGLPSSVNLFRGLRMSAAPSFAEFVAFAIRKPVLVTWQYNGGEQPGRFSWSDHAEIPRRDEAFDRDATRILNRRTPFRLLKQAALESPLPAPLRYEALLTAFTRGLMLGEDLDAIAEALAKAEPDLAGYAEAYRKENHDEGRRFAAAFLLLHRPEARPYFGSGITRQSQPGKLNPYRDNWWCPLDIPLELGSRATAVDYWYDVPRNRLQESAAGVGPEFLDASAAEEAGRELTRLQTMSAAADFLGNVVLAYAKAAPDDERIPEALSCLVRAGHYGCSDTNTWKTSRAAFRLLHTRYPRSVWAARTPTWFRENYDIRDSVKERTQRR